MVLSRSIKQFDRLGSTIKEAQASTRNITAFQKLKQDLSAAETAFRRGRDRLAFPLVQPFDKQFFVIDAGHPGSGGMAAWRSHS